MVYVGYIVDSIWSEAHIVGVFQSMGEAEDAVLNDIYEADQGFVTECDMNGFVGDTYELINGEFQLAEVEY